MGDPRTTPEKSYLALCREEPFRIFFPLGVLAGISGVSLWPLYFTGIHQFYPGIMHARLMIEGFMGAFVIGFLGTAGPRLTGTAHFSRTELWSLLLLFGATIGTHIGENYFAGDLLFLALLLLFAARMSARFSRRTDLPPPTFALVAFAFVNAIAATILLIAGAIGSGSPRCTQLGMLLLYQGFVLYLVLGIGGFLLPRFLVLPAKPELPETREITAQWGRRALFALAIGLVLLASFVVEVFTIAPRMAALMRFLAAATFLASEIPLHRSAARRVTLTRALRLALILLVLGLFFPVLWPWQRVAGLHLVFIGGFTLVAFTVATRVVLGHTGQGHLVAEPLRFLRATTALLLIGAAFRISGDFFMESRGPLLNAASYAWIAAALVWSWRVLRRVRVPDETTET
ncbi:MAG TPA: NnrS family protein [Chthoniobacteraceae bacterium]|nr:NnrS family protein [Chthoniobacteraceae bacterium]